ncbi:MAG: D-glycero-beta-D-manno-heptose-7-phosphate kinase [Thermodesulfobacteriota bacterium]
MNIKDIVSKFKKHKILVVGDIMLDHYIFGKVDRVSPEAPVPVVKHEDELFSPGGAANVMLNLNSMGAKTALIGTVGKDKNGVKLLELIKNVGIRTDGIIVDKLKRTTLKTRIVSSNQQLLRIDREDKEEIDSETKNKVLQTTKNMFNKFNPNAVIISDYNKGLLTREIISTLISECKKQKIFIGIDPKGDDFSRYKGVNLITPNIKEAETASKIKINDESSLLKSINNILKQTKAGCVLITKGKSGISYKIKNKKMKSLPAEVKEVFDVTGAGDTFISAMVLSYLSTKSFDISSNIANKAAGISVTKFGATQITQNDLILSEHKLNNKIVEAKNLSEIIRKHKKTGKKIVFTNGCFDLFHHGHLTLLNKSKSLGDILIVAINSDSTVNRLKGNSRPIVNEKQRAALISSLEFVDYVTVFEEITPLKIIKTIKPDIITKGTDYNLNNVVGKEFVENYGGRVELIQLEKDFSTTSIVKKIKENN